MISVLGNRITIPQGETASVSFTFKDIKTQAPLIIPRLGDIYCEDRILFKVVEGTVAKKSKAVLTKEYLIDNTTVLPPVFETRDVLDYPFEITTPSGPFLVENNSGTWVVKDDIEPNTLYRIRLSQHTGYVYYYCTLGANEKKYDYADSTLNVQFDTEDTISLSPKIYYYTILHEVLKDGEVVIQETLIEPSEFRIKGAI